jgi:DNA-binding beta-propeller fold protein YncE
VKRHGRQAGTALLAAGVCALAPLVSSCRATPAAATGPYRVANVWGQRGGGDGHFAFPRALALDGRGHIYVIDKSARIQKFTTGGQWRLTWTLPASENGKPDGLSCDVDGNLLVADTHYSRLLVFSPEGELLRTSGSYGTDGGHFVYPTGVSTDASGNFYLCEYGGHDRVQKLDSGGAFLLQWGSRGDGPGQFQRPMNIDVDARGRVYVADACNHRIQVFSDAGELVDEWGGLGDGPGRLKFPYDVKLDPAGNAYVTEYGAHRISKFSADGEFICSWGEPGTDVGQLNGPWGAVVDAKGRVYVADTGNHRIQVFEKVE